MQKAEFTPPARSVEIISLGAYPDGRVHTLTGLIMDGVGKSFTLTISTAAQLVVDSIESPDEVAQLLDPDHEPIFVVAGENINPTEIENIIENINPKFLSQYLVVQES
jgi:hypothetical protein